MARLVTLVLAAVLVAGVSSFGEDLAEVLTKKYAMMKVAEDCYGRDVVRSLFDEIVAACNKCRGRTPANVNPFLPVRNILRPTGPWSNRPFYPQSYVQYPQSSYQAYQVPLEIFLARRYAAAYQRPVVPYDRPVSYDRPASYDRPVAWTPEEDDYFALVESLQYNPFQDTLYGRVKRQAGKQASTKVIGSSSVRSSVRPEFRQNGQNDDNQSNEQSTDFPGTETTTQQPTPSSPVSALELRLREQIRRIVSKISNMTCVMQEIGLMDADKKPAYDNIKARISVMPISEPLKKDMYDGIDSCREYSKCVPVKKTNMPMVQQFAESFTFMRCFRGKQLGSCMKKDLLEKLGYYPDPTVMQFRSFAQEKPNQTPESDAMELFSAVYGFDTSDNEYF